MSIVHKAYLFRYNDFQKELVDLLYRSLETSEAGPLRTFIHCYRESLTDQATEEPLAADWEEEYGEEQDVQQLADLALTRYYDLTDDRGLSYGFDALGEYLRSVPDLADCADILICGYLFGPRGKRLDPGSMGTGFVSPQEAARLAKRLAAAKWPTIPGPESKIYAGCYYRPASAERVRESLDQLVELHRDAAQAESGLLLVDYNDRGVSHL